MSISSGKAPAIGIDLVAITRIKRIMEDHPEQFRNFAFTTDEQQYCDEQTFPHQHYAARWAVKEAFIKALREPESNPNLTTIEVVNQPAPQLSLSGETSAILDQRASQENSSLDEVCISISMAHEQNVDLAIGAVVISI